MSPVVALVNPRQIDESPSSIRQAVLDFSEVP
jgi:hypothetical protein